MSKLRGLRDTEMKFKKLLGLISNRCEIERALYETSQSESSLVTSVRKPIQGEAPSRTKDEISILTDKQKEISNLLAKCSTIRYTNCIIQYTVYSFGLSDSTEIF